MVPAMANKLISHASSPPATSKQIRLQWTLCDGRPQGWGWLTQPCPFSPPQIGNFQFDVFSKFPSFVALLLNRCP